MKKILPVLAIIIIPLLLLLSTGTFNFPSADDYAYLSTVENIFSGEMTLHPNLSMTFWTQGFIGSLVSQIFGFSSATLSLTSILLAVMIVATTYLLLRNFLDRKLSALAAILISTIPIFFYLSHTFMTEIPFIAISLLSILSINKGLTENKYKFIFLGAILAILSFWVRQYGMMILAGLILFYLLNDRKQLLKKHNILLLFVLPAIMVLIWAINYYIFGTPSDCIENYFSLGFNIPRTIGKGLLFIGYFLFPLGLFYLFSINDRIKELSELNIKLKATFAVSVATILGWLAYIWQVQGNPIFYFYSFLSQSGMGNTFNAISGIKPPIVPELVWIPITFLSIIAISSILLKLLSAINTSEVGKGNTSTETIRSNYSFLLSLTAAWSVPLLLISAFYDRYFVIFTIFLMPFAVTALNKKYRTQFLAITIIALALISWYGTTEYIAWNTARWEAIDYLLESVDEKEIDGGFEYNARFFEKCHNPPGAVNWHGWGYSLSDQYVISFSPLDNYTVLKSFKYADPFGNTQEILALNKTG